MSSHNAPQWIALSPSQHGPMYQLPRDGYHFAAGQAVAGVLLAELNRLLPEYVLGFIREAEGYRLVALLGLGGQNLYVAPNGKWLGSYVPATLRGYPYRLATPQGGGDKVLAIEAMHLSEHEGEALFAEDGKPSAAVSERLNFLTRCEHDRARTAQAARALEQAGVITPWPLKVERGEGQAPLTVEGLYRIDEAALNALSADAYTALQGAPMALAHAQLFASSRLEPLTQRARFQAEHESRQTPENLDELFGEDDDELSFEFD